MKDKTFLIENGVDIDKALELFGDMDLYNQTLQDFLKEIEPRLDRIKNYKEISDMANYAIEVHALKSDSKYFGFTKLADFAYNHELESKKNNMFYVAFQPFRFPVHGTSLFSALLLLQKEAAANIKRKFRFCSSPSV